MQAGDSFLQADGRRRCISRGSRGFRSVVVAVREREIGMFVSKVRERDVAGKSRWSFLAIDTCVPEVWVV